LRSNEIYQKYVSRCAINRDCVSSNIDAIDRLRPRYRAVLLVPGLLAVLALSGGAQAAQPAVQLGTATGFAVLGGSTVTNTGPTVVNGDLGVAPGAAITGFPPATLNGTSHAADAVAAQAQADLTAAYDDAAGRTPEAVLPADLGGLFLTAGVYRRPSSLGLTGDVTLDAEGDPDAVFILKAGTLTTASNSRVQLTGRAQACNVFWQIASSATLGSDAALAGDILALQSITMNTRAALVGRALARNGAVTLDTNTIDRPGCTAPGVTAGASPGATPTPTSGGTPPTSGGTPLTPTPGAPAAGDPGRRASGTALLATQPRAVGRTAARFGRSRCVNGSFRAVVTGVSIRTVTFLLDGRRVTTQDRAPFGARFHLHRGVHKLRAHVTFTGAARPRDLAFRFRACERETHPAVPSFTG